MADDPNERWAEHNPLIGPGPEHQPEPAPKRSWGAAVVDTGLDLAAGVVGAGRQIQGAVEGLGSAIDPRAPGTLQARQNVDTLADLETSIKGRRSEERQETDRTGGYSFSTDPGKYLGSALIGMIPYAPLAMMGPYGVPVAAALGFGQVRSDVRENVRNAPIEEMRKNPQYADLRDQGISDADARERIAVESTDPRKAQTWLDAAPNMIGQAATSGFGSAVMKGLGMPAMRGIKTEIAERVIEATNKSFIRGRATGVGMGATSGAMLGGGADLSTQLANRTAGMQTTPVDWGRTGEATAETAALFGPLGLGYRRPARFRGAPKAAAPSIGTDTEAVARDMASGDATAPWGHRPTAAEPWGPRPDTEADDLRRQQQNDFNGMPVMSDVPGPREMVEGDLNQAPVPEMHPVDYMPIAQADEARGMANMEEQGYGAPFSRRPYYGEPPPGPSMGEVPKPPRGSRAGMQKMREGDLGTADPNFPPGEFGPQTEPRRPAKMPAKEQRARGMTAHDLEQPREQGYEDIGTVPRMPGEERPGEQEGPPYVPPPHPPEPPPGRIPRVGPPELPGAGDFPHEGTASSWRGGPVQRVIADHLKGAGAGTRGQIAAMLQAGARRVADLPKATQNTLSKIRNAIDRGLEFDRQGTIDAIRGDAVEVGRKLLMDDNERAAVEHLRRAHPEMVDLWGDHIEKLATAMNNRMQPGLRKKSLIDAIKELPENLRVEVESAFKTNPREFADTLRGKEHKPPPAEYVREGEVKGHQKQARAERKAEADTLTLVDEKPKEEPAPEHGPRADMTMADIVQPEPPPKVRQMVTRDIYPSPPTLGLSSEKVAARARKDAGKFKGRGMEAIAEADRIRRERAEKAGTTVQQQRAMTEQGETKTTTMRKPTVVQTVARPGVKPEAAPAAPVTPRVSRPPKVLPRVALTDTQLERYNAAIRKRQEELQRQADAAQGAADRASGPRSKAAFERAAQAALERIEQLEAERKRLGTLEHEQEMAAQAARAQDILRDTVAESAMMERLYGRLEDLLKRARQKWEKANKDPKETLRQTAAQKKAEERKPTYTKKNLIAGEILKVADPKERQTEIEKLDDIVTGKAVIETTRVEVGERKAEGTKRKETTVYRKVDEKSALLPDPMNFITAGREHLLRIAKALVARAEEKIADAGNGFVMDHTARLEKGLPGWNVSTLVSPNRGPHGIYLNHLALMKRFIRAVKQFKGSEDMLRTMILNHYMAERLVMEGKSHKLKQLHDEQINFLRDLAVERYKTIRDKPDSTDAETQKAKKALDEFNRELDDALYTESIDETHYSVVSEIDLLQRLEDQGVQPGAINEFARVVLRKFVADHNNELLQHLEINERRKIEGKEPITPYDQKMARIHGDRWYDATPGERTEMIDERAFMELYGGKDFETVREPRKPATGPSVRALEGPPEAGAHREAVPGDITQSWQEQVRLVEAMDRPTSPHAPTREHAARNLTPENRELRERIRLEAMEAGTLAHLTEQEARAAERNSRIQHLMERAEQIRDQIETLPGDKRDLLWEHELRFIEDELRQHYEETVPGAKKKEYGIGQVLEDASDLSKPGNLPRGAYVRRVIDFLRGGARDIREGIGTGALTRHLRRHLMTIVDQAVGNMEVVALTSEQMRLAAEARGLKVDTPAFYDRQTHRMIVSQEVLNRPDRAGILGHEMTHPLTLRAMELLPDMRKKLEQQLQMLRDAYRDLRNSKYDELRRMVDQDPQILNNIHELVAQLYNDGGNTARILNQIEVPIDTSLRWRKGLQGNLQAIYSTLRGGLNDLLFRISRKKLLNDTLLTTLDAFGDLQRVGEFQRPRREGPALPYTTVPEKPMPKAEQELWSKYRALKVGDVLAVQGKNRGQNAASLAIAENGTIHDVGLHDNHVTRAIKARGLGGRDYRGYFDAKRPTNRPWVHVSKFTSYDGAVSVGIEHSPELTRSQASVVRQIQAEVRKAQRDGEKVRMLVQEYVDARYVKGNEDLYPGKTEAEWARDMKWEDVTGSPMETGEQKAARLGAAWEQGPTPDYTLRGSGAVRDYLKFLDQHKGKEGFEEYNLLSDSLRAFQHLIGDVEIRVVDNATWRAWVESVEGPRGAGGVHYDNGKPYVALPKKYRTSDVVHELAHAATMRALNEHPEFSQAITGLAERLLISPEFVRWQQETMTAKPYGFHNAAEFVAEFYSNWNFRELTKRVRLSPAEIKAFTGVFGKKQSLFQIVTNTIAKWLGMGTTVEKLTGAMLRDVLERQGHYRDYSKLTGAGSEASHRGLITTDAGPSWRRGGDWLRSEAARAPTVEGKIEYSDSLWKDAAYRLQKMGVSGSILKASTFVDLRRRAEQAMQDAVLRVEDAFSKIETTAKNYFRNSGAEDISRAIAEQMRLTPKHFQQLQDYTSLENHYRVSGSEALYTGRNKWVSKDSPYHEHYRKRHAELQAAWNRLTPEQKAVRNKVLDYYEKRHGEILDKNLRTVIKLRDMNPAGDKATEDALVRHVMREELSDADKTNLEKVGWRNEGDTADVTAAQTKFKQNVGEMRSSPLFKKIQGVWYPAERRGQWVVSGRYDLSEIGKRYGGRMVDEHGAEWEFDSDAQAQKFYSDVTREFAGIHHEGTTQHVYEANPDGSVKLDAEGKPVPETYYSERTSRRGEPGTPGYTETTTGAKRRVSAKAAEGAEGVVTRHRVEFNPLLVEFYEKEREGYERHDALKSDLGLKLRPFEKVRETTGTYLDPKKASRTMGVMMDAIERGDAWRTMDDGGRRMLRRDLEEAAARHIMSASARSQRIPRRYAMGADKSLLRDFNDYARNTSMTLAEMHHRPDLSKALKDMDDYVARNRHWTAAGDEVGEYGTLRSKLQTEVYNRVFTRQSDLISPWWEKKLARIMQLSFMDKLMSPGFVVLNASEPWVLGLPLLSGHHGFARSSAEIGRAYGALGFGIWGKGFVDAYRAAAEGVGAKFEDNHTLLRDRVAGEKDGAQLQKLLDYGAERGYLDRDAGMELAAKLDPSVTAFGKGVDYLDNISRQVNQQIENVNRGVIAIAAYRMALPKMGHEKAMQHAFEMVHDTSGNYGHWNTPAMFSDPRLKMALQFKRYSQRIVANYVRMFVGAYRATFGDKPTAENYAQRRQLAIMLGSQMLLSGTLGLPTEPIKAALLATSLVTGFGPDEAEVWSREAMAKLIGNDQLAEAIMRGFPRAYLDIGIGTRLGHDSLLTHGTLGKKPDNWFAFVGHTVLGAPGSMLADWGVAASKAADTVGQLARGNYTQAGSDFNEFAGLLLPIKLASDSLSAYNNYTGGPKTTTPAGQPLGYQPNIGQALLEASGIRSGTQQEASDKRFALTQAKAEYAQGKQKIMSMYVRASTPSEKRSIQEQALRNFNPRWPKEKALTVGDFVKAENRFKMRQSADPGDVGVMIGKKDAGLRDRFSFFNV